MDIIQFLLFVAFVGIPVVAIFKRIGISPWWALLAVVPLINIIALNYIAFIKWPFRIIWDNPANQQERV